MYTRNREEVAGCSWNLVMIPHVLLTEGMLINVWSKWSLERWCEPQHQVQPLELPAQRVLSSIGLVLNRSIAYQCCVYPCKGVGIRVYNTSRPNGLSRT